MQTVPIPVYPWLHVQVKAPSVLIQVALGEQLSIPIQHSLISIKHGVIHVHVQHTDMPLPAQLMPLPVYPWRQEQVKLPLLFRQIASGAQLSVAKSHSSISYQVYSVYKSACSAN